MMSFMRTLDWLKLEIYVASMRLFVLLCSVERCLCFLMMRRLRREECVFAKNAVQVRFKFFFFYSSKLPCS